MLPTNPERTDLGERVMTLRTVFVACGFVLIWLFFHIQSSLQLHDCIEAGNKALNKTKSNTDPYGMGVKCACGFQIP